MLRAKFEVSGVEKYPDTDPNRVLKMRACITEAGDNKDWSKYTPSGDLTMHITNENLFGKLDALKPGDVFFLDLTKVD